MPKPGSQSCASCQFFGFDAVPHEDRGWCVRYPPKLIPGSGEQGDWPVTRIDWWCGEWKQAAPEVSHAAAKPA